MINPTPLTIDERLASELSGSAKVAALLGAHGYTYKRFAQEQGFWATQVKLCVYGTRRYPRVRDALARVLELPREEVDCLLDLQAPAKEAARWAGAEPPSEYSARAAGRASQFVEQLDVSSG